MFKHFVVLSIATCFIATAGADLLTPLEQNRYVRATASATEGQDSDYDTQTIAAEDFAPFDASIYAVANIGIEAWAGAWQSSWIDATQIHGAGNVLANAFGTDTGSCWSSGTSSMSFTFDLAEASDYELTGYIESWPEYFTDASARVTLSDSAGALFDVYIQYQGGEFLAESGILSAGAYTLKVEVTAGASAWSESEWSAQANYNVDFTVPEPTAAALLLVLALSQLRQRYAKRINHHL